jgi:hypothetical protein
MRAIQTYQLQFKELGFTKEAAKALIKAGLDSFVDIASLTEDDVLMCCGSLEVSVSREVGRKALRFHFYLRNI